jgi:hypothetical protein
VLDLVVVVLGYVSLGSAANLTSMRTLRVLRMLRLFTSRKMKVTHQGAALLGGAVLAVHGFLGELPKVFGVGVGVGSHAHGAQVAAQEPPGTYSAGLWQPPAAPKLTPAQTDAGPPRLPPRRCWWSRC